ncbi:nicotinate mononucleotide-dependent phosphoribosyltransferase CobT [Motiliproteus sp. MSK22-1]|uniref:nicotinate mononucleotide-dependent phosphoribosyltransferase CobT n=1 Tax=Motiliproteus sp. MSK22-1 TaxID=1897630 RepID=UPI0009763B5C|nr:TIGR00303 family protein [Motiliproteus sp. MSK22-1]OMH34071.1 TIGR00303 family protein [Motiliproteus sp. MSK22-1]
MPGDRRVGIVAHQNSCQTFLRKLQGTPLFTCTLASTATAQIPGISAAGATPEKRRYTAALDGEALIHGQPKSLDDIPKSPEGPPSPVVISIAALRLQQSYPLIIDAGCEILPKTPVLSLAGRAGRCITSGRALSYEAEFITNCQQAGGLLAQQAPWLILAESVPGGTTTALALLEGLGIQARGSVSSSFPGGNHRQKEAVVDQALKAATLTGSSQPALEIVRAIGDPMQPAIALMALEASLKVPVVLGGGTQMAAVAALIQRLYEQGHSGNLSNIALATTAWVAKDPSANLAGIINQLPFPMASFYANLSFDRSSIPNLQRYEEGLVKEGVGAGAAAFSAFISAGVSHNRLLEEIETVTRELCCT